MIDLIGIAGEDDLGALARAGHDRLDLVRREVLRLVDDHVHVRQRATADVRQRLDLDEAEIDELRVAAAVFLVALVEAEQQLEVVVDRLHPRVELFFDRAGQIADVSAEWEHRSRHEQLREHLLLGDLL